MYAVALFQATPKLLTMRKSKFEIRIDKMKKRFLQVGVILALLMVLLLCCSCSFLKQAINSEFNEITYGLKTFENIDELEFLKPYYVEEISCDMPAHVEKVCSHKINYEGTEYTILAYSFDTEDNAWLYFCSDFDFSKDVAHCHVFIDNVEHIGQVEAVEGKSYYIVSTNDTKKLADFISYMNDNLSVPVYLGEGK